MSPNPQETAVLVTFTEEIHNGKLHFLPSDCGKGLISVRVSKFVSFLPLFYLPGKYVFVEYSWNIPMIYSQNIRKKFPMKYWRIFPNNVKGILNTGRFPECSMNILRMLHTFF